MHVWLRSEPLNSCAINYPISNHINANTLRKTVNYAKNKGISGYPKIEYSIWRYIACNKISIPEHVAWMYFQSFFYISNYGTQKNMDFDIEIAKCKSNEEIEKLKDTKKVDLYQFIIHLFIQQFYSIDLKSSVMSKEEWPVNRHEGTERRGKSKTMDELNFMNFITKNLDEIISLFLNDKAANQNDLISEEILQAFNFILEGSIDNMQTILKFNVLLKQPLVQSKINEGKIYAKSLITFLKNFMEINPFGLNNCLRSGKRITPSFIGGSNDPRKIGRIVTNNSFAPAGDFIIVLGQVVKQTLIECSEAFSGAGLYIDKCLYSHIYILKPLRSCTIKKCRKTLIFIGPTQRSLTIDSCVECCIVSVSRRVIIRNCSMCTFHLLTPSNPILLSGCDNIVFAPYNSYYSDIEDDSYVSGLADCLNIWNKPIVVTQNQSLVNGSHWSLMDPKEFSLLTVPVEQALNNKSAANANELISSANEQFGILPDAYEKELNQRYKNFEENIELIQETDLNDEQQSMLQKYIEGSFKESLQLSGEQRQLEYLSIIHSNTLNQSIH